MSATAGTVPPPEWYLARDGDQFGPLSDVELRKLVEFGHLKPTDLLWREGFPDWRSARILLTDTGPAPTSPAAMSQPPAPAAAVAAPPPAQTARPIDPAPQTTAPITQTYAQAGYASGGGAGPHGSGIAAPQGNPAPPNRASYPPTDFGQKPAPHPNTGIARPANGFAGPHAQPTPGPVPQGHPAAAVAQAPGAPQRPIDNRFSYQPPPSYERAPTSPSGPGGPAGHVPSPVANPVASPAKAPARPIDMTRPAAAAPVAAGKRHAGAAPVHRAQEDDDLDDDLTERSRGVVWAKRFAVLLFFALTLAAAGWALYPYRDRLLSFVPSVASLGFGPDVSPVVGFQPTADATDAALQKSDLWKVLKRDFPEWYGERIKEAAAMAAAQRNEPEIGAQMMQSIVALRRKHAGDALSATTPKLKSLANAFAENLVRLRQVSVTACHGFIAAGETSPDYLRLLADSNYSRVLQTQLVAVFEAIADGRTIPRVYPQPRQADYNLLVTALEGRGWTEADMQLFSDSRRFGQAPPEKVCKMVTDWFQAQIGLTEPEAQLRLLADALKPVVAG